MWGYVGVMGLSKTDDVWNKSCILVVLKSQVVVVLQEWGESAVFCSVVTV
ncbi:MAG: hypothetical protein V8Q92_04660 [Coprococcus comes]